MLNKLVLTIVALVVSLTLLERASLEVPHSRWQVVQNFEIYEGVPVYGMPEGQGEGVKNDECVREIGADVVILGDSILHGVRLDDQDTLGPMLSRALQRANGERACVVNLSIPGFTLDNDCLLYTSPSPRDS